MPARGLKRKPTPLDLEKGRKRQQLDFIPICKGRGASGAARGALLSTRSPPELRGGPGAPGGLPSGRAGGPNVASARSPGAAGSGRFPAPPPFPPALCACEMCGTLQMNPKPAEPSLLFPARSCRGGAEPGAVPRPALGGRCAAQLPAVAAARKADGEGSGRAAARSSSAAAAGAFSSGRHGRGGRGGA